MVTPQRFVLHPQLQQDTIALGRMDLCQVLLMNDSQFPWLILVPEIADIRELFQLNQQQRQLFMEESCHLAETISVIYQADKINIGAIGNMVPQLHIHHIVRFRNDKLWPAPIWGKLPAVPYTDQQLAEQTALLKQQLSLNPLVLGD